MRRQIEMQLEEIASLRNLLQSRTTEETASLHRLLKARGEELEQEKMNSERLTRVLQEQTTELESLRRSLREKQRAQPAPPPVPGRRLKISVEHNLSFAPVRTTKDPSGLLCPRCYSLGESVEMNLGGVEESYMGSSAKELICPRCLLHDWKRQ